jgi:nucleoside-diphosphate-sugar epimerase
MRLVPLLRGAGYAVHGTTRSAEKTGALEAAGATPIVVDVYNLIALTDAMLAVRPSIVIHQLTDLPAGFSRLDEARRRVALERNARIRKQGTRNLVDAALQAGATYFIAQSLAWVYAPGPEPHSENDPLDEHAQGNAGVTIGGVLALEQLTLASPPLVGTVLRYGQLYGPGTGNDAPVSQISLHVDAAGSAALLAVQHPIGGVFNFADPNPHVSIDRAVSELGWDPAFRLPEHTSAANATD